MKRLFTFLLPFLIALFVIVVIVLVLAARSGKGALQVTSLPKSNVYLEGKLIGQTPLCKCEASDMIKSGEYSIKLDPLDTSFSAFEQKITISNSVLTVVDRTFGAGAQSEGSIITLESINDKKNAQLFVVSFPSSAHLYLDSNQQKDTPLLLNNVTESDHEARLQKDGYKDKTIRIRGVPGYKLNALVFLGVNPDLLQQQASASAVATPSASLTPALSKVIILDTPTGFLNVRDSGSISSAIIGKVNPGELYQLLDDKDGWYQIQLNSATKGWISNQYAQRQ